MTKMDPLLLTLVSFGAGAVLGVVNYRLFLKSVGAVSVDQDKSGINKQMIMAGIFRHIFVFSAGICLIRGASFAPFHLCGGLLLANFFCRIKTWRSQQL